MTLRSTIMTPRAVLCASLFTLGAGLADYSSSSSSEVAIPTRPSGDPTCPCLSAQELEDFFSTATRSGLLYHKGFDFNETLGGAIDPAAYGVSRLPVARPQRHRVSIRGMRRQHIAAGQMRRESAVAMRPSRTKKNIRP